MRRKPRKAGVISKDLVGSLIDGGFFLSDSQIKSCNSQLWRKLVEEEAEKCTEIGRDLGWQKRIR